MSRAIASTPHKIQRSTSWDGQHVAQFDETNHRYTIDGVPVKGATTIGGAYPKGEGLIQWMIKQGIDEYVNKASMKKGADVGTILHSYAEAREKGLPFDQSQVEMSPYKTDIDRVIGRFDEWRDKNNDKIVLNEVIVALYTLMVGGKIDTLRERPGLGLVLSDYKTAKGIYMSHLLQVAGLYRRMLKEWLNLDVPYVEIVTFPKQAEEDIHILLADAGGCTKDGVRIDIPDFFVSLEKQAERNIGTYRFQQEIDNKVFPYIPKK